MGPGPEIYERFGHNALRIEAPGRTPPFDDISFNYGMFDFGENPLTDFIPGFIHGNMLYWVDPQSTPVMFDVYREFDRSLILQELNLTPEQNAALAEFLWNNSRPENRSYVYAPYNDNCSTRVRDAIDRAAGGQLKAQTQDIVPGHTFRFHTRRIMASVPPVLIALEFVLGQNVDKPLTRWDEMFLPGLLERHLRDVQFTRDDGQSVPAIRAEKVLYQSTRPELPEAPPPLLPWFALAGLAMAAALLLMARLQRRLVHIALNLGIVLWTGLAAFAGCFAAYAWLFTDHWEAYRNENLLQMPPVALIMLVLLPWGLRSRSGAPRHPRALRIIQYSAAAMAGCGVLGLLLKVLPWFRQDNWNIIAWVLPVNMAIAIILARRGQARPKPAQ